MLMLVLVLLESQCSRSCKRHSLPVHRHSCVHGVGIKWLLPKQIAFMRGKWDGASEVILDQSLRSLPPFPFILKDELLVFQIHNSTSFKKLGEMCIMKTYI